MIPSPVSNDGYAPVDPAGHGFFGPGAAKVYQPPAGVFVLHAAAPWVPSQQICGGVMALAPVKSEAAPERLAGAPVTQMFVALLAGYGLALARIDLCAATWTWQ